MKYEPIYIRTDKNGTKYYADYNCPRCGGNGYISYYGHVDNGVCFKCGGSGRRAKAKIVKVYTEEYAEKLEQRRRARAIAKTPERNARFLENMGFNTDGTTWVVLGNTYAIKDELKERGAKYNRDKEVNDKITLKGTVKAHDEYKGTKQTVLTRCRVA